jgi:hypothetical protein
LSLDHRRDRDLLRAVVPPLLALGLVLLLTRTPPLETSGDWPAPVPGAATAAP